MKKTLLLSEWRRYLFLMSMLTLIVISCKKDKGLAPVNENNTVLSKNSPDYLKRLSAIKEKYYSFKFDQKLIANVNQKYSWIPDWEHPRSQIVNDTVSYVFSHS